MDLPANTVGDPHAIFDSTGLVFAVTATMAGGAGHVSTYKHRYPIDKPPC